MKKTRLILLLATVMLTNCTTSKQFLKSLLGNEDYGRDSMQENINAIKAKVLLSKNDIFEFPKNCLLLLFGNSVVFNNI